MQALTQQIPNYILKILHSFNEAGFEAYIVGGAVRDLLLGKQPHDYDVTTNALPEQTIEVCKNMHWKTVDNLGNNFGCVVAIVDNISLEITTFRGERYDRQIDAHRPSEVWFCQDLREDLARRDFTINAMAMDANGKVYDFFGGQQDLERKILRTVGDPNQRFKEDALRMFRACRFVAQLSFTYVQKENLAPAFGMDATPYRLPVSFKWPVEQCKGLSLERVRTELEKLLAAPYASKGLVLLLATGLNEQSCRIKSNGSYEEIPILPELSHLVGLEQNRRFHCYDTWEHTLLAIDNSPCNLTLRWVMLLHDVAKGLPGVRGLTPDGHPNDHGHEAESAKMTAVIMDRFRYPTKFSKLIIWLVAEHMRFAPILFYKHLSDDPQYTEPANIKRTILKWIRSEATKGTFKNQAELVQAFTLLKTVYLADMGATNARNDMVLMSEGNELADLTIELASKHMPVATSDLAINGKELLELVGSSQIKNYFAYLLERVQSQNLANEHAALIAAVNKKLMRKQ